MNINDSIKNKVGLGLEKTLTEKNAETKTSSGKSVAGSVSSSKAGENVTLSPMSVQLQALQAEVSTSGVFDAEKVEAIKSAISSGQFKVDSEKVADGLLDTVKDLIQTKQS
jgi:negative regulator of flagellin synthesis FlgM